MAKLVELGFQLVDHPPYSPDLAPSDYHLFLNLNKHLKGTKFHTISDAMAAMDDWFEAQPKSFFLQGLQNLEYQYRKCVGISGESWGIGEPDDWEDAEDCVYLWAFGVWNDVSCDYEDHYGICEKKL
ncbi:histone-lysine N-methyltransferase SETMAR-like [Eleutherodactylus coqui]|uniref:histone-lysine N-methyltransferase SETMAR-like n=1 Tax=Eleutherodactylus coqui TaxID=57060 RepID=UPI003461DE2E